MASTRFHDDFAKLLYACTDDADAEVGDSDDFGWFVCFEFKPNRFDSWLEHQKSNLKKYGITADELDKVISGIDKKAGDTSKGFVCILTENTDNEVSTQFFSTAKGKSEWAQIEKNYEAFEEMEQAEDTEEYDPETDEIEEDDK